ncbi:hypothetical protein C5S39_09935 [Candidatus Methanophagaceae archaeon]|nr:hypothetical protein C5S39_09935 [Methanophagales archaeon]
MTNFFATQKPLLKNAYAALIASLAPTIIRGMSPVIGVLS